MMAEDVAAINLFCSSRNVHRAFPFPRDAFVTMMRS